MIILGGVNTYPAEIENCLVMHEKVMDVAVFGLPDPDMGEFVQAVVQLAPGAVPGPETADELRSFTRSRLWQARDRGGVPASPGGRGDACGGGAARDRQGCHRDAPRGMTTQG
jgi:acyl-CoA synthetase (AMP-forming)/AMP-acid ligase II